MIHWTSEIFLRRIILPVKNFIPFCPPLSPIKVVFGSLFKKIQNNPLNYDGYLYDQNMLWGWKLRDPGGRIGTSGPQNSHDLIYTVFSTCVNLHATPSLLCLLHRHSFNMLKQLRCVFLYLLFAIQDNLKITHFKNLTPSTFSHMRPG